MSTVIKLSSAKTKSQNISKARDLGLLKLESSGLDEDDAQQLGMTILTGPETHALWEGFRPLAALKIPYYDHNGQPIPISSSDPTPFYRIRYLEDLPSMFGEESDKKKKKSKYMQVRGSNVGIYFPRNQNWLDIVDDPDEPIIITEGELKAAKACKEGFPTIGLGGVQNWRSTAKGIEWHPMLEPIFWHARHVYICFDSDLATNRNVRLALIELAEELHRRGAIAHLAFLPPLEGLDKVGMDDFLVHQPDGVDALHIILKTAPPLGLTRPLLELNKRYVVTRSPVLVVDQKTMTRYNTSDFKILEAPARYRITELNKKGDDATHSKTVPAAEEWLRWPMRNEAEGLVYEPGLGRYTDQNEFNLWQGWAVEPQAGDVHLFTELLDFLFDGADPAAKRWFLQWLAYPLQHPGIKMYSACLFHGVPGVGKSLLAYNVGRIYGKNSVIIKNRSLVDNFNDWSINKQFVIGEEISGSDKRKEHDLLKNLITQEIITINQKYIPSYQIRDCLNYFFSANHPDAFFLEDRDRRYFIHEIRARKPLEEKFYQAYDTWYKSNEGLAALFAHLLGIDLTGFNPRGHAFMTSDKERMISLGRSDAATWVHELLENPDAVLRCGKVPIKRDLFTSKELLEFFYDGKDGGKHGLTANGLTRILATAGVRTVCDNQPIYLKDGTQGRYLPIRNREKWEKATRKEVTAHLNEQAAGWEPK